MDPSQPFPGDSPDGRDPSRASPGASGAGAHSRSVALEEAKFHDSFNSVNKVVRLQNSDRERREPVDSEPALVSRFDSRKAMHTSVTLLAIRNVREKLREAPRVNSDDDSCLGLCSDSTVTRASAADDKEDSFPILYIIMALPDRNHWCRACIDTASDVNFISESMVQRLGGVRKLRRVDATPSVVTLSGAVTRVEWMIKLTFFILGLGGEYKDHFYVIGAAPFDVNIGEKFTKTYKLLSLREELLNFTGP
jgi:hypothetical protein